MSADRARTGLSLLSLVRCWCLALGLLLMVGCAATSTTVMDEEIVTNQKPMQTYKSLLLRDFELKNEIFSDVPESRMGERERRYARIPAQLTDQIQRYLMARRIYQSVSRDEMLGETTLILKGKFTRMGRFRISIEAMLLDGATNQEVAYFRQTLWDVFDTTEAVGRLAHEVSDFIDRIQYK